MCLWCVPSYLRLHSLNQHLQPLRHLLQETRAHCVEPASVKHTRAAVRSHSHLRHPEGETALGAHQVHPSILYPTGECEFPACLSRRPSRSYRLNVPKTVYAGIRQRRATEPRAQKLLAESSPASAAWQASSSHEVGRLSAGERLFCPTLCPVQPQLDV